MPQNGQDLTKEKSIWVLKCLTTALLTTACVLIIIFGPHWTYSVPFGIYAVLSYLLFFNDEENITSEVFFIKPNWEELANEKRELFTSYNPQMQNHLALLTYKIEQQERTPAQDNEERLKNLRTARDMLQKLWNWVEKGE